MKLKTTLIALTVISFSAIAGPHHRNHEEHYDRMYEKLGLTESQQEQLKSAMQAKHEKMKAAMEVIHEETQTELASFLTEEQLEMLESRYKKHRKMKAMAKAHKTLHKHDSDLN